jgi:hypothetical protein
MSTVCTNNQVPSWKGEGIKCFLAIVMVHEPVKKNSVLEHVRSWIKRD